MWQDDFMVAVPYTRKCLAAWDGRWVACKCRIQDVVTPVGYIDYLREEMILYSVDEVLLYFPLGRVVIPVDVPKVKVSKN